MAKRRAAKEIEMRFMASKLKHDPDALWRRFTIPLQNSCTARHDQ
jgi:hypothetical protein